MTDVSIGPAQRDELPQVLELLEEGGLPPDGLEERLPTILVARLEGRIVGSAALELYGSAALLRSVAVRRDLRGTGLGRRLTESAVQISRELGAEEAYLLTETADLYFPRFGFKPIPRSEVPASVRRSVEFTSACPASARVMMLALRAL
ncbi:MAG TPA: arsenic resistance N-acetyltransferase ArsN2 [Rubrobacteraceae bacterium]|nr:arsenic resistance N-acetyltransferase ArsN2 [Rubrobacteraceae bacterium]